MMDNNASALSTENYFGVQDLNECSERNTSMLALVRERCLYDVIWVREGSVQLIADATYTAHNDAVWFFGPGELMKFQQQNCVKGVHLTIPADFFCITGAICNMSFLAGRHSLNKGPFFVTMDAETKRDVETIMLKLEQEFNNVLSFRLEIIKSLFNTFLLYMSRHYTATYLSTGISRDAVLLDKFFQMLRHSYKANKKVYQYASKLNLTPNYLNQVVKKLTGFTASYHIQQQIILEAKKRALDPGCSMKEVAYGLGFDSMAHFSKFFKTKSGSNFTMFRKDAFCAA